MRLEPQGHENSVIQRFLSHHFCRTSLIKHSEHPLFQTGLWIKLTFKKGTEIPKGQDTSRTGQQVSINLRDKFFMLQLKPPPVVCKIYFFASPGSFLHLTEVQE